MIASVQYNDYRGTAAADISDFIDNSLQNYLINKFNDKYDGNRYTCQGCNIWIGENGDEPKANIQFICWDKTNEKHIKFYSNDNMSLNETFSLFKRLNIVIGIDINEVEVDEYESLNLD